MADVGATSGTGPIKGVPARTAPVEATPSAAPAPKLGTDGLALSKGAEGEYQYFGHKPKITLSMLLKQPIWGDDRTKIDHAQWAQMPEAQRKEILAMIPTDPARAQFLSHVDPAVAKAKEELGAMVKKAWDGAVEWSNSREAAKAAAPATPTTPAAPTPETSAQVDRLNALIDGQNP